MKKILLLSIILVAIIAGCTQEPTGKFLANQLNAGECLQDWKCTDWSDCIRSGADSGMQNRTCIDNNNCNNLTEKPHESRICGLPKIALKEPDKMALENSDLPKDKNWTTTEKNIISSEEVSQIEKELGFIKGYYVHHSSQFLENNNTEFIDVYNYVSVYPVVNSAINMSFSFDAAKQNYKIGTLYEKTNKRILSIYELPSPNVGDYSIAYNITVISDVTGFKENIYTICFTKLDVAEVVTIDASKINYEILRNLAKILENRIV